MQHCHLITFCYMLHGGQIFAYWCTECTAFSLKLTTYWKETNILRISLVDFAIFALEKNQMIFNSEKILFILEKSINKILRPFFFKFHQWHSQGICLFLTCAKIQWNCWTFSMQNTAPCSDRSFLKLQHSRILCLMCNLTKTCIFASYDV